MVVMAACLVLIKFLIFCLFHFFGFSLFFEDQDLGIFVKSVDMLNATICKCHSLKDMSAK